MLVIAWYSIFLLISATGMTGLNKLSTEAILCYIAFLFCFFFGMMLGGVSLPNGMKMLQQEQKIKKRHASAIVLIYCFFIFYSLIALLNIYYFNKVDLSSYRQAFFDGSRDNVKYFYGVFGFYFYYLLSLLVFALVPYTIITNSKKTISLCFFALLLYDIIFLSRTGVYYFILSYIVSSILLKKGIKKIIIVGMVALLFSLIMSYTRDMKSDIIGTLFSSIINYHIAPFVLFDENIISNHLIKYNGAGLASLGIYNIIFYPIDSSIMSSINDFRAQLNEFYDLGVNRYLPYNAYYTSLGGVYIDSGLIGSMMVSFMTGFIIVGIEKSAFKSTKFLVSSVFFTTLCMESIFSPIILNIFAFTIIVYLVVLMVLKYENSDDNTIFKKYRAK